MADAKTTTSTSTSSTTATDKPAPTPPSNQPSGHGPAHTPNAPDPPVAYSSSHGWGWIIVVIIIVLALAAVGWVYYRQRRAKRLGLAPPSLNPFADSNAIGGSRGGGIMAWFQGKYQGLRNKRTAGGAYEGAGVGGGLGGAGGRRGGRRGLGALDPDEAWDSRVGNEADVYDNEPGGYYEEQELSLRAPMSGEHDGAYSGKGYGDEPGRGQGRSELDERYDVEMGRGRKGAQENPFGDHAAEQVSLRSLSPRPHVDTSRGHGANTDDSPTERKSMFKENV